MPRYSSRVVVGDAVTAAVGDIVDAVVDGAESAAASHAEEQVLHAGSSCAEEACQEAINWDELGELGTESIEVTSRLASAILAHAKAWLDDVPLAWPVLMMAIGALLAVIVFRLKQHWRPSA